jgi:hypothetical protein
VFISRWMAARLFRTFAADEVVHNGGYKVGPVGTGGRTYRSYTHGGNGCGCCHWVCISRCAAVLLFTWAVSLVVVSESSLSTTALCVERAAKEAVTVADDSLLRMSPADVGEVKQSLSSAPRAILHVPSDSPAALRQLRDPYFALSFAKDVALAERRVEHCQWQELQQTSRVRVGRDTSSPQCREAAPDDDRCNIYRTDVSFAYVKGWHSTPISSALFDNPVAYHNPSVSLPMLTSASLDPVARVCLARLPRRSLADAEQCLSCSADAMEHGLLPAEHFRLSADTFPAAEWSEAEGSSNAAAVDGFTEWDSSYVYRRHTAGGTGGVVVNAALAYFADGVLGFEGPATLGCTAGDIRVHWRVRRLSRKGVSVVGELDPDGSALSPFICDANSVGRVGAKRKLLAYPRADLPLEEFLWAVLHDAKTAAWWLRLYSMLLAAGSFVLLYVTLRPSSAPAGTTDN